MGAILDGNMMGCSPSGDADVFTGAGFGLTMWVHLPDIDTEQYLYCDVMKHADNSVSERFCVSILNKQIVVTVNDAPDSATVGTTTATPLAGVTLEGGWTLINVNVDWDAVNTMTTATATVTSEATGVK